MANSSRSMFAYLCSHDDRVLELNKIDIPSWSITASSPVPLASTFSTVGLLLSGIASSNPAQVVFSRTFTFHFLQILLPSQKYCQNKLKLVPL